MIKFHLADLLESRGMNVKAFSDKAKLSYKTALDLKKGNSRRIDLETLEKICVALNVTPGDLLEFVPNDSPAKKGKGK